MRIRIMQQLHSPHILVDLLIRPIDLPNQEKKDLLFYRDQDLLQQKKINSGLDGVKTPCLLFNILDELDRPKIIKQNINLGLEILNEDIERIESQLASGESPLDEQEILNKESVLMKSKKGLLVEKIDKINTSTINMMKFRKFIPLALPTYEQYLKFITTSEDSLFFNKEHYAKFQLNQKEYEYYELLFSSAISPQDLLELSLSFIGDAVDINKIALCSYEPAIGGFNLYINEKNQQAFNGLTRLEKKHPDHVKYLDEFDYWVIKEDSEKYVFDQLISIFDIWFDYSHLSIYSKKNEDIEFNLKTKPCEIYNSNYLYGVLFYHIDVASKVDGENLMNELILISEQKQPNNILFFDGFDFKKANNNTIWSYAEMVLIQYKCESEPDIDFMAIYSAKENKFLFLCEKLGHISDKCLLLFKNTISLLNINAFEQVNPNVILASD